MKIGVNNIYTSFVCLLLLTCGGWIIYFSITDNVFHRPFNLIYIFLGISILFTIIVFVGVLYNFRCLAISNSGIVCVYPFLLRKKEIQWRDLVKTDWEVDYNFLYKNMVRKVVLRSNDTTISFSDLEFENFNTLIKQIPNGQEVLKEINMSRYTIQGLKRDFAEPILYSILVSVFFYFLYPISSTWWGRVIMFTIMLLQYASVMRIIRLIKVLKMLKKEAK